MHVLTSLDKNIVSCPVIPALEDGNVSKYKTPW